MIRFNFPYETGNEIKYIEQAIKAGRLSGDGQFTKKCHRWFEERYGFQKALLTTSCTDALEMSALLLDIGPGDEVIVPSYTFVSTANAFVLRGAKIVFADSEASNPNLDVQKIEELITPKTKVVVPMHYAGVACDMDALTILAERYNLYLVEDAAQAIESFYKGRPLGGLGHLAAFSFHETKNVVAGEGGLLVINRERFSKRAEIVREKGTNRSAFFRGEVDKYGWVDIGSSYLPSELNAAFLYAQLEQIEYIEEQRIKHWLRYKELLGPLAEKGRIKLPFIPSYATVNGHMFYILARTGAERDELLKFLKANGIGAVFHYLSLHKSKYFRDKHDGRELPFADYYTEHLIRLPLYVSLEAEQIEYICSKIYDFFKNR